MSGWVSNSLALVGFTEPPYWMRTVSPAFLDIDSTTPRMWAHMSWASCAEAVRPVPMAHTGS